MMIKLNRSVMKKRQYMVLGLFIVFIIAVYGRIVYFQYFSSYKLSVMANSQYSYKEDITDANYMLFDSNGKQLLDYKKNIM
ncbi:hypothetical protein [Clostridium muellerianum]|uniref:hypothetical protein n=1 Tax=Clostridium muellerianum TaxID=2716538 RepID=UPI001FAC4043|nr:hypothetical protein [Clostridium muellerianum]